ncbi:MAG: universal stress protein [Thermoanaerobaculia bacterium]
MKRFKKILCYVGGPADPSSGLESAADLAERNDAHLTLMDVLPESTESAWLTIPGKPELEEMVVTSRIQDLEEMAAGLRSRGLQVATVVTKGSPFVELTRRVVVEDHDLVIKTAQGLESRLGGLLGTTALHLMRKCPAPVWVVKPPTSEQSGRVMAAVDPRPDRPGDDLLGIKVLELASSLAEASGSKLHVVHAWWLHSEAMLRSRRINLPPAEVDGLLREVRGSAEQSLDALVGRVDLSRVPHEIHIVKGQPYEVISGFASQSDVAVIGTMSRGGVDGLLIGNTAERILRRVDCSVVAVKPEGFLTPLRFEEVVEEATV